MTLGLSCEQLLPRLYTYLLLRPSCSVCRISGRLLFLRLPGFFPERYGLSARATEIAGRADTIAPETTASP